MIIDISRVVQSSKIEFIKLYDFRRLQDGVSSFEILTGKDCDRVKLRQQMCLMLSIFWVVVLILNLWNTSFPTRIHL